MRTCVLFLVVVAGFASSRAAFSQSSDASHVTAKTSGSQSPVVPGSSNKIIYDNRTYTKVEPNASKDTRLLLQGKSKTYLGSGLSWNDILIPAKDRVPASACGSEGGVVTVFAGSGPGAFTCKENSSCILLQDSAQAQQSSSLKNSANLLSLEWVGGSFLINGKLLGSDRKPIALFQENNIYTYDSEQAGLVERPDPATLRMVDANGDELLYIRYANTRSLILRGKFYSESGSLVVDENKIVIGARASFSGSCFSENHIGIAF